MPASLLTKPCTTYEKYKQAARKFSLDFGLDYTVFSGSFNSGKVFDILDMKTYSWPGRGNHPRDRGFQVLEAEFMKGDEYDALIADPEFFYSRIYMPRAFGALAGLGMLSTAWATVEMPSAPFFLVPFGLPEGQKALKALLDAGQEALNWVNALEDLEGGILAGSRFAPSARRFYQGPLRFDRRHGARHAGHPDRHVPPARKAS